MNHEIITAIVVAGVAGTRLKSTIPKGFVDLGGKLLFLHSLELLLSHEAIDDAVLVVPAGYESKTLKILNRASFAKPVAIAIGGIERYQSVQSGVDATQAEWVLVHDAARPFVSMAVIDRVLEKRSSFDGVITATPEIDTVRLHAGDVAGEVIDRSKLVRVQTPQLFRRTVLIEALKAAPELSPPPTDDAVLVQRLGIMVGIASGDPLNFKITTPADIIIGEALLEHRQAL